ncbi:UBA/TPR/DNAJ domain-containing protein Ucp7 [Schizosaccharomyces cryophilus OY26]|uniref:UBA/TPR/DNAJ domain-containing protein Ucp7 n=1 Tax=Schizosaccharomyces cryophilus (strain OY26 / ATCC MYA-4695 / CBS 11777 / NBRC 106824 / NRRL Y48691) TaxID=653667 RepID=S9W6I5_SCHCR|nr:UBA/TPR/DNAJ domain-containing protein Ucp7 [Schizosaccharomyces cryophilus OY26]EPY53435.1 UBA/TPR/DNAJ domain-containing protein Ucp7 [Schizosaccharomyces cryophilus OY26]
MEDLLNFDLSSNQTHESNKKKPLEINGKSNSPVSAPYPQNHGSTKDSLNKNGNRDPFANLFQKRNDNKNTSINELERKTSQTLGSPSVNAPISHDPYMNLDVFHHLPKAETKAFDSENKSEQETSYSKDSLPNTLQSLQLHEENKPTKLHTSSPELRNIPAEPVVADELNEQSLADAFSSNTSSQHSENDSYAQLRAMGFSDDLSTFALQHTGSLQEAIELIFEQGSESSNTQTTKTLFNNEPRYPDKLSELQQVSSQIKDQLFSKATDLWNIGRQKIRTAVEERRAVKSPNQPRWMTSGNVFDDPDNQYPGLPVENRVNEALSKTEPNSDIPLSRNDFVKELSTESVSEMKHESTDEFNDNLVSSLVEVPDESISHQKAASSFNMQKMQDESLPPPLRRLGHPNEQPPLESQSQRNEADIDSMSISMTEQEQAEGNNYYYKGDFSQAIENFSKALSQIPESHTRCIPLLCNRSLCYMKIGDIRTSLQDSEKALEIIGKRKGEGEFIKEKSMNEFYVKSMIRKAQALEQLEKYELALESWTELLSSSKVNKLFLEGKSRCERALGGKPSLANPVSTFSRPMVRRSPEPPKTFEESERLSEFRNKQKQAEKVEEEKNQLREPVQHVINKWKSGKEGNIRALLSSLDTILWPECRWKPVSLADLVLPKRVKVAYMKAISCVHPDKLPQQSSVEQRLIAESAFSNLNEAWDLFKQQNQL